MPASGILRGWILEDILMLLVVHFPSKVFRFQHDTCSFQSCKCLPFDGSELALRMRPGCNLFTNQMDFSHTCPLSSVTCAPR